MFFNKLLQRISTILIFNVQLISIFFSGPILVNAMPPFSLLFKSGQILLLFQTMHNVMKRMQKQFSDCFEFCRLTKFSFSVSREIQSKSVQGLGASTPWTGIFIEAEPPNIKKNVEFFPNIFLLETFFFDIFYSSMLR